VPAPGARGGAADDTASPSGESWNRGPALLVAAVLFMEHLDGTILVTAAPAIAADLGVSGAEVGLAITAYLITVATAIPVGGWLASRFGPRRVFCSSIVVFTLASVLCALSGSLAVLVLGRVLQGLGGAMMVPVGRLIVLRATQKQDLLRAIAYITWPALLAPVLAPLAGGLLTAHAGWPWIFLVNVPLGVLALVAALRIVPDSAPEPRALDWRGLLWCTAAVFGLVTGMELVAGAEGTGTGVLLLVAAAASGILAVRWLLRTATPLLDLRVYRVATYRTANAGGFVYRLVISSVPFLLPLLFQDGFGWSPVEAGLLVTAVFVGNLGVKPATTPLLRRFGFRAVLIGAVAGGAGCLAACTALTPDTPVPALAALLTLSGALRSIGFSAYNALQFADVAPEQMPSANTLSATGAQLAGGLGVAAGALALQASAALGHGLPVGELFPYHAAFGLMAALLLVPLAGAVRLSPAAAAEVTGRPAGGRSGASSEPPPRG
jgi:EmrB/QacA subfamily drug resistance transporter